MFHASAKSLESPIKNGHPNQRNCHGRLPFSDSLLLAKLPPPAVPSRFLATLFRRLLPFAALPAQAAPCDPPCHLASVANAPKTPGSHPTATAPDLPSCKAGQSRRSLFCSSAFATKASQTVLRLVLADSNSLASRHPHRCKAPPAPRSVSAANNHPANKPAR